jgi:hypothetical protein
MNAIAYTNGSQNYGLSTESNVSCVSYVYVLFSPALIPDGRSLVSLIDFCNKPIGKFGCGSVVKINLKSGWGPYFGVNKLKIPPVPIKAVYWASASLAFL